MRWMLMPLRRYAEFSGRSRRKEYWLFFLGLIILYVILMGIVVAALLPSVMSAQGEEAMVAAVEHSGPILWVAGLVWLALLIPNLAVGARRLHDIDRSARWLLIGYGPWLLSIILTPVGNPILPAICNLVSLIGFIILLILACLKGTTGPNRFGPDPKAPLDTEIFA